jgi:hypothetical protein
LTDDVQLRRVERSLIGFDGSWHYWEMAIRDVWECGCVKLVLHTDLPPNRLTTTFHDLGVEFSRQRALGTEHVLEFYQNLYERPRRLQSRDGHKDVRRMTPFTVLSGVEEHGIESDGNP